ncbi:TPA: BamA/TamA family outer membrane protein [Candidatus Spyradomonas excrementavium]|nr:BamA/TamA family outer membrane protein [Candidatus Spyradomonas excrementavium]
MGILMMLAAPAFAEGEDSPSSRSSIFGDLNTESLFNTAYPSSEEPQQEEVKQELPKSAVYIKNIEITGNRLIDTDTVYRQMELKPGDAFSAEVVQQNLKSIYNMGYFSEKIKAVPVKLDDNNIKLKIIVEENLPVTDFMIEGNESISTGEILKILEPMLEKPQNIHDLNDAIEQIQDLYASQGYILARVTNVTDDPDGTVNLTIDEGTINSIIIQGNKKTKEFVVRRNVLTQPGTVYNENLIKMDLMRLYGTQAFKDVKRTIERSEENPERYDVTIHLEEQRTGTISIGGGLDTATGLFGSAGFTENNFRGMGQRISLNVLAGTGVIMADSSTLNRANLQAEISWFEPKLKGSDNSLMVKAFGRDFASYQIPLAIEQRYGIEATISHPFKEYKNLSGSFGIGLENVDVKEGDYNQILGLYNAHRIPISERAKQLQGGVFLTLSPSLIYDTRDNQTNPRKGVFATARFDEAIALDGFENTYGKLTGSIKRYYPVGKKSTVSLAFRAGGKVHGDSMPEVMAYRLGGPYTVRGFRMSGIGTGTGFMMGSAEFLTPIPFIDRFTEAKFLENIRLAAFVDAGQIYGSTVTNEIYNRPLHAITAGIGVRVFVPGVGPLAIDWGYPLTGVPEGTSKGAFTFGVGEFY